MGGLLDNDLFLSLARSLILPMGKLSFCLFECIEYAFCLYEFIEYAFTVSFISPSRALMWTFLQ